MKWVKKIPKYKKFKDDEFLRDGWIALKEPKQLSTMILLSIPLMILIVYTLFVIINYFVGIDLREYGFDFKNASFTIDINIKYILGIIFIMFFHELIHLIFIPNYIKSSKTYIGLTFFLGFVYTEEVISRDRFILITIAPLIIISILMPIVLGLIGLLNEFIIVLILLNGGGASVDIFNLSLILAQVSKDGMIVSNGSKTYWKKI